MITDCNCNAYYSIAVDYYHVLIYCNQIVHDTYRYYRTIISITAHRYRVTSQKVCSYAACLVLLLVLQMYCIVEILPKTVEFI